MRTFLHPAFLASFVPLGLLLAFHLLRSAGKGRGLARRSSYSHELRLKHEGINRHHLRNGGVLLPALAIVAVAYALALLLWAYAGTVFALQEPRW